jgi:hypothetical protein
MRPEGLGKIKIFIDLIGLEYATFRLVEYCLNLYAIVSALLKIW